MGNSASAGCVNQSTSSVLEMLNRDESVLRPSLSKCIITDENIFNVLEYEIVDYYHRVGEKAILVGERDNMSLGELMSIPPSYKKTISTSHVPRHVKQIIYDSVANDFSNYQTALKLVYSFVHHVIDESTGKYIKTYSKDYVQIQMNSGITYFIETRLYIEVLREEVNHEFVVNGKHMNFRIGRKYNISSEMTPVNKFDNWLKHYMQEGQKSVVVG